MYVIGYRCPDSPDTQLSKFVIFGLIRKKTFKVSCKAGVSEIWGCYEKSDIKSVVRELACGEK